MAAHSHIVRDVLPYEIVGGNPAKHIRFRFSEEIRNKLLEVAWWDWPIEKVISEIDFLSHSPRFNDIISTQ